MEKLSDHIIKAIRSDDIRAFSKLYEENGIRECRLGRFPVLSACYLFGSGKIIKKYEKTLLPIAPAKKLAEPFILADKFRRMAGKALRLYADTVVSPAETLLILDKTKRLKKVFPLCKADENIKDRLRKIYRLKYSLDIRFDGDAIDLDKRPLNRKERKILYIASAAVATAAAISVGAMFIVNEFVPFIGAGNAESGYIVANLSQIDFSSNYTYILKRNVTVPNDMFIEEVNCNIDGNGKTLEFKNASPAFGVLYGKMYDITIKTSATSPLIQTVYDGAEIHDIDLIAKDVSVTINKDSALLSYKNYGDIKNVAATVDGKIEAEKSDASSFCFGGIVAENSQGYIGIRPVLGNMENCTASLSIELTGDASADAAFAGIVGYNNGTLKTASVSGSITADTFDVAGVCNTNNYTVTDSANKTNIIQTSSATGWSPISAGIAVNNAGNIERCVNAGNITASTSVNAAEEQNELTASAAGIAFLNRGTYVSPRIISCENTGKITASAENATSYAAGICVSSNGPIESCENTGDISSVGNDASYAAGVADLANAYVYASTNSSAVTGEGGDVFVGGIASQSFAEISYCYSSGTITGKGENCRVGGVLGFATLTSVNSGDVYFSTIVKCISECMVGATGRSVAAGGIVGRSDEQKFTLRGSNTVVYLGGAITDCYFTGASGNGYFGAIAGCIGSRVHAVNSYAYSDGERKFYENNRISSGMTAIYETFVTSDDGDETYAAGSDLGTTKASVAELKNDDNYKTILNSISETKTKRSDYRSFHREFDHRKRI